LNEPIHISEYEGLIREVLASGGEFRLYPHGTSMLPLIKEGRDTVTLVKPDGRLTLDDIALYKRSNGQFVLHRVVAVLDESYAMCGDNQAIPEPNVKDCQILARVSKLTLKGKAYSVNDKKIKRYVDRRRNLKLRRISIAIKNRLRFYKK